jgi:hypothetical protein
VTVVFRRSGRIRRGRGGGVQLAPVNSEYIDYAANLGQAAVEVELSHEYEEDYGIPFERYASLFTVRDFGSDLARQEALAREIFERLASLGRYSLMLVLDLEQLIEKDDPRDMDQRNSGS